MDQQERAQIEREVRATVVRRYRARLGLMWHAGVFVLANLAMIAINLRYTPETLWCLWPLGGWGAALMLHAFSLFHGSAASEAMIQAEVARELARRGIT